QVRRYDYAEARAGFDIDVRIDAALADQPEPNQPFKQDGAYLRALAYEHQAFSILQAPCHGLGFLQVVVPDRNLMVLELLEAGERAQRVEIIVQDGYLHATTCRNGHCARQRRRKYMIKRLLGLVESQYRVFNAYSLLVSRAVR